MNRKLAAVLVIFMALAPAVSAGNMTHIIPAATDLVVNQTTIFPTSYHTPFTLFIAMECIGLIVLAFSVFCKAEHPYDIFSYISPVALFFATLMAILGIDIKTSVGAGILTDGTIAIVENHTIYTDYLWIVFCIIILGISVLNLIRVRKDIADQIIKAPE